MPLTLEHGFSTFILASDDEAAIRTFGERVAPALRDAVAGERTAPRMGRAPGPLASPPRSPERAGHPTRVKSQNSRIHEIRPWWVSPNRAM